uniref:De novo designed protein OR459 n=1 Tax=synthetic construct TaxID=32630 RepID=UPI0004F13E6B|nr:Chain A, De novo designed protein OR459 [synthetic construct]
MAGKELRVEIKIDCGNDDKETTYDLYFSKAEEAKELLKKVAEKAADKIKKQGCKRVKIRFEKKGLDDDARKKAKKWALEVANKIANELGAKQSTTTTDGDTFEVEVILELEHHHHHH